MKRRTTLISVLRRVGTSIFLIMCEQLISLLRRGTLKLLLMTVAPPLAALQSALLFVLSVLIKLV